MLGRRADWFVSEKVTKAHKHIFSWFCLFLRTDKCLKIKQPLFIFFSMISFKISWINAGEISPGYVMIFDEINRVCL